MTPTSTYRLQITPTFRLQDAAKVLPRLADLGVSAVYLSPILTSTTGSDHGYDVTDPATIDAQRGGEEGWQVFTAAARQAGLGIVVDIVPNHMGIAVPHENPYWWDVLTHGEQSPYASWFDIDWARGTILVPVLADESALDDLRIVDGELRYWDNRYPLAPGTWAEGDDPREVHERQHYRLVDWRRGDDELAHRRFFTVQTLAGLRIEDPAVFAATHERILRLVTQDHVEGLRVDHPDGLVDPATYFDRLSAAAPDTWLVAEKILEPGERLPAWKVQGTTGYDAMTQVNQLFIDQAHEEEITRDYVERTGDRLSVGEQVLQGKREMATHAFGAELSRILSVLPPTAPATSRELLVELAVHMPVYRTYLPTDTSALDEAADAVRRTSDLAGLDELLPILRDERQEAARRFQQLTGAVMAKGIEDTAWYRANRFVALNEVGGDPATFGSGLAGFHAAMALRETDLPESMTSLSTHDTKRGEDVRARLAVLSEVPAAWQRFMDVFMADAGIDDPQFGELLAQTLAGTGVIAAERLHDYATKAMREAHTGTSWTEPDADYEAKAHRAIDTALRPGPILDAWQALENLVEGPARSNSLSQKLVQLTMPGIPDVYQGTEVWDDSLVDPDNRRPVDHEALAAVAATGSRAIDDAGSAKLHLVRTALRLRREHPELFHGYRPLTVTGPTADHLVAFERDGVTTLATRLPVGLADQGGWGDATVQLDGTWTDQLSGTTFTGPFRVADLLADSPVALLVRH